MSFLNFGISILIYMAAVTSHAGDNQQKTEKAPCKPADTVVMGGLDCNVISEYVGRHSRQISQCHKKEAGAKSLEGRFFVQFLISDKGKVTEASTFPDFNTLKNKTIEECVGALVKKMNFPAPTGGGIVEARYPFSFPFKKAE